MHERPTHYDVLFKVVLVGEPDVGKSHLVYQYVNEGECKEAGHMPVTVGVQF